MPAVTVTTSSTEIVPENKFRTLVWIKNADSAANCHINFGATATTDEAFLAPGESFIDSAQRVGKAAINGISSSGSITVKYSVINQGT